MDCPPELSSLEVSVLERLSLTETTVQEDPVGATVKILASLVEDSQAATQVLQNWEDFELTDNVTLTHSVYSALIDADVMPLVNRESQKPLLVSLKTLRTAEPNFRKVAYSFLNILASYSVVSPSNMFSPASTALLLTNLEEAPYDHTRMLFIESARASVSGEDLLKVCRSASVNGENKEFWLGVLKDLVSRDANPTLAIDKGQALFRELSMEKPDLGYSFQCWLRLGNTPAEESTEHSIVSLSSDESSISLGLKGDKLCMESVFRGRSQRTTFEGFNVERGTLYHIVIRHSSGRRPKVCLYVDGDAIQTIDLSYPFTTKSETQTRFNIEAKLGAQSSSAPVYEFSNFFVVNTLVQPEWCLLSYLLGRKYTGNYQDRNIIKYLTYKPLRQLEIRLQELYTSRPGLRPKKKPLDNLLDIQQTLVDEGVFNLDPRDIILNFNAQIYEQTDELFGGLQLCKALKAQALKKPLDFHLPTFSTIQTARIIGGRSLSLMLHAVGGPAILLKLVESCPTTKSLELALETVTGILEDDWAMLKEFESKSGYDILSTILKTKKELISLKVLDVILGFVGYDHISPIDSLLVNPQAYVSLVADFEIWSPKRVEDSELRDIFKFVLFQFTVFGQTSRYSIYNLKLMVQMKIIKRFIQALKYGSFAEDILPVVHDSLLVLVKVNPSPEVLRSLSLYVIYSLKKDLHNKNADLQRKSGICVLDVLVSVACDPASSTMPVDVKRFYKELSRSITVRWSLLLLYDRDPTVIKHALRLLIHLFTNSTPKIYPTFISSNGIDFLTEYTMDCWAEDGVVTLLFAGCFGIFQMDDKDLHLLPFVKDIARAGYRANCCLPELLLVINNMVKRSIDAILQEDSLTETDTYLNFVSFQNGYLTALTEMFCKVTSFKNFATSSAIFLENLFDICLKFRVLIDKFANEELSECFKRWCSFFVDVFLNEISEPNFRKSLIFDPATHYGTTFAYVLFPFFVERFEGFQDLTKFLIAKDSLSNLFTSLGIVLSTLASSSYIESVNLLDKLSSLVESLEGQRSSSQKLDHHLKVMKDELGLRLVQAIQQTGSIGPKALLEMLITHQAVLMDSETTPVPRLAILLSYIAPMICSEVGELAINFTRMCFLHRQSDFGDLIRHITTLPEKQVELRLFFDGLLEMSDEEVKGSSEIKEAEGLFESYRSTFRSKKDHDERRSSSEICREICHSIHIIRNAAVTEKFGHEMESWVRNISNSELNKYNRRIQDQSDDLIFFVSLYQTINLEACRLMGLEHEQKWMVDQTELTDRMRMRMIRYEVHDDQNVLKAKVMADDKPTGPCHTDLEVKSETGLFLSEDNGDLGVSQEDKKRKILRSLYVGDRIAEIWNVSEILGLKAIESILIMGTSHVYLLENYFHCKDGEIVGIDDAPKNSRDPYMDLIAGEKGARSQHIDTKSHKTKSWEISKLVSISKRQFLLRDVALELFFVDGTSFLITCKQKSLRDEIYFKLSSGVTAKHSDEDLAQAFSLSASSLVSSSGPSFALRIANALSNVNLSNLAVTKKWRQGRVSNFYYLMIINTLAGRTFNDLTQYPIFPWVIADYTSQELDLSDPKTFRDLSKPMGAQSEDRVGVFKERFSALQGLEDPGAPPFHYGTHYSSAMIVSSFLIRLEPFVQSYLLLQGGKFDHADRLFYSIGKTWDSCSKEIATDVRELIPEFFYLPEFLVNSNNYDLGKLQGGKQINDVELPPWAHGDPKIFIQKNREALESEYVSRNLHKWIDLIFGFKQRGKAAVEALNVFHHLSYPGAIDLDKIEDEQERRAMAGIIHNFGQTPMQLFTKPHPQRDDPTPFMLDIDCILDIPVSVSESTSKSVIERIEVDGKGGSWKGRSKLFTKTESVTIRGAKGSPSMAVNGVLHDHMQNSVVTAIALVSATSFLTGCKDGTIQMWTQSFKSSRVSNVTNARKEILSGVSGPRTAGLEVAAVMRGHVNEIVQLKTAPAMKMCVSLDSCGRVLIWDTLRLSLIREIPGTNAAHVFIANDTGTIGVVSDINHVSLYTINGDLIIEQDIAIGDRICSVDFVQSNWIIPKHGSPTHHEFWEPRCMFVAGLTKSICVYKVHNSIELMRKFSPYSSDADITAVRMKLSAEIDGNGSKHGRAELVCGDAKGKLFVWH